MRTRSMLLPAGLTALALGLLVPAARAGDLLDEAKAKQAVEAQRMEKMVRENRAEAERLFKVRPADAVALLKGTLASLETDRAMDREKRDTAIRRVGLDIKFMNAQLSERNSRPADVDKYTRPDDDRRLRAENEAIRRREAEIRDLRRSGKYDEARRQFDDMVRSYPSNPSVRAGSSINSRDSAVREQGDLKRQREASMLLVYRDIDKTASRIPVGEIEFPRDWAEKSKRRASRDGPTEKEKAIIKALNTVIEVEFDKNKFQEVLDYLEKKTGQPLIVDKQAMMEVGVTYDSEVTLKTKTTLRTILKKLLGDLNLAYMVKDQTIQITTIQKAKETLSTRTYYVGDLATVGDMRFGPLMARAQMAQQIAQLAVLITQTVEPESWAVNEKGGLGTIAFNPVTMSFVVRQTAEIHYQLGLGMR